MSVSIKLSSTATHEFWEVPVLFEDEHLLALDKPAGLPASPDRTEPARPCLIRLLHSGIAAAKPWAAARRLTYLMNAHRLDAETTGVLVLAKSKSALVALANWFSREKSDRQYVALVEGTPAEDRFEIAAKLAPHPARPGVMRVDARNGKRARSRFEVLERFSHNALLKCAPLAERPHQLRAHLSQAGLRLVGDGLYGGRPLWLSRLKPNYRLKEGRTERPLLARAALHAEQVELSHPATREILKITAPWPKDLRVAVKYLRLYSK